MRKGEHSREVKTTVVFVTIKRKWFSRETRSTRRRSERKEDNEREGTGEKETRSNSTMKKEAVVRGLWERLGLKPS